MYGPLILLLTKSIVEIDFRFKKQQILYFIPFTIYAGLLAPYFLSPAQQKIRILTATELLHQADFGWMNHLTNYLHLFFVLASLIYFYVNKRKRTEYFSDNAQINVQWLQEFLWALAVILGFSLFTFYARKFNLPYFSKIYPAHFVLVVAVIYWIAYKLLLEKNVLSGSKNQQRPIPENADPPVQVKYSKSGLGQEASGIIARELRIFMEQNKPYLNSNLTIGELSGQIAIPRHQLSQVINSEFDMNFFDFVNQYRLREFKQQALNPSLSHLSLLGIALECGFNSKATFNQVFKKSEGITPSEFVKRQKQQTARV
jgi:AraC-like DNA-binding protein